MLKGGDQSSSFRFDVGTRLLYNLGHKVGGAQVSTVCSYVK